MHVQNMGLVPYNRTGEERERERKPQKDVSQNRKGKKSKSRNNFCCPQTFFSGSFHDMPLINIYFHSCILGLRGLKPKSKKTKKKFGTLLAPRTPPHRVFYTFMFIQSQDKYSQPQP